MLDATKFNILKMSHTAADELQPTKIKKKKLKKLRMQPEEDKKELSDDDDMIMKAIDLEFDDIERNTVAHRPN